MALWQHLSAARDESGAAGLFVQPAGMIVGGSDSNSNMPPPQAQHDHHFDYLDGWRGLAIALLLVGHFFPLPGLNLGALGVNFFFVLSGWLMTRLLFLQQTPIDTFYRRRIARIVPAHVVFVASVCLAWWLLGRENNMLETTTALFFVNNYVGPAPGQSVMPLGHIWSLSVEEHSYVLLSLVAVATRKHWVSQTRGVGVVALGCAACAFGYNWLRAGPQLQFDQWLHTEVAGYGIFVSGFILLLLQRRRLPNWVGWSVPIWVLIGVALHWWSVPLAVQKVFGVGSLALAVNLLGQSPQTLRAVLAYKPLRHLGLWSFSLYLWQQPFYLWSRAGHAPTWLGLLLAIAAGLASYYLVEQPVRRYLNRTWGRPRVVLARKPQ